MERRHQEPDTSNSWTLGKSILATTALSAFVLYSTLDSFSLEIKQLIAEKRGTKCYRCGTEKGITYHHSPPAFYLKAHGINPDQPQFGRPFCRECHDEIDAEELPYYRYKLSQERNTDNGHRKSGTPRFDPTRQAS